MNTIGILGSGRVGTALASGLAAAGHHVVVGTRSPQASRLSDGIETTAVATAISRASTVINATPGDTSLERLSAFRDELAGSTLVDVSNATTRGGDGLPGGLLYPAGSLGEELQRALPDTRVVKTLNTMLFSVMAAPRSLAAAPTAFLSGDDATAKADVAALLHDLGWADEWIVDLGGIGSARGTEAMALLVPSLLGALGFVPFALGVSR
jgi:predicted dinucleotide-binding enzyme